MSELGMIRRYGLRRVLHLVRPGRRERERNAQVAVAAAARSVIDKPVTTGGLSLRQIGRLYESGLRVEYVERVMFNRTAPEVLERLLNDAAGVRAEFPHMYENGEK